MARPREVRSLALHRRGAARAPPFRLGAVRRRRPYVPGTAFRLHAGQMFWPAFFAEPQRLAGARLHPAMADVADPETEGRLAGDAEGSVSRIRPTPAPRGRLRRCHRRVRESAIVRDREPRMAAPS